MTILTSHMVPGALSIRTKASLLMFATVSFALLLSTATMIVIQLRTDHATSISRHEQIARIVSANMGAALMFDDKAAAAESLATVANIDDIGWARVYKDSSEPFAAFTASGDAGTMSEVRFPVLVDGAVAGELRMGVHYLGIGEIVQRNALVALLSFAGSLLLALAYARWAIWALFRPVNRLLDALRGIFASGDYSVRLKPERDPELAVIGASFNAMLGEVEARSAALSETAAQLREARDQAEQASVAKSQFLANMSHELRTPLNAIIGYTEVLHEELAEAGLERSVEDVSWIHSSARQLLELINGILDLSKIEAGRMVLDRHEVDVSNVLREVGAMLDPIAAKKRNTLHIQIDPLLKKAFTDSTKLRQCLLNLGSNACKFTENGHVFVHGHADGDELVFSVSDTGIGMTEEQLQRLFQPFMQADASTTRKFGGTGLGLTITWRFAEMLGGRITVESTPGQGSTFTLRIAADLGNEAAGETETRSPALQRSEAVSDESGAKASGARVRPLALIVEDEPSSVQLLTRLVEQAGYDAVSASDGAEGLRMARTDPPDLVLLDILMPKVNGWDVLKAFDEDERLKAIPTVVVTVDDDRRRVFEAGACEHLVKPVNRSELANILKQYSGRDCGAVLIVDDDPATARLWERGVTQMGYETRVVHDGQDALTALAATGFDFVITDLRMPQIDGFELVSAISKMPAAKQPHVIVVTGKVLDDDEAQFLKGKTAVLLSKRGLSPRKLAQSVASEARQRASNHTVEKGQAA